MLPLPLFLLLLVQGLYAAEFPNLTQHVRLTWGGADIYSLDGSQTVSVDGKVPYFTICGPFRVQPKDVLCKVQYFVTLRTASKSYSASGNTDGEAKFHSQGSNYTCMSYPNFMSNDFIDIYNGVPSGQAKYDFTYICPYTPHSSYFSTIFAVIFVILVGFGVACAISTFKAHQNKKSKESVSQNASSSYANAADFYGGNNMNINPTFTPNYNAGNPPAYGTGNPAPYIPPAIGTGNPGYGAGNTS